MAQLTAGSCGCESESLRMSRHMKGVSPMAMLSIYACCVSLQFSCCCGFYPAIRLLPLLWIQMVLHLTSNQTYWFLGSVRTRPINQDQVGLQVSGATKRVGTHREFRSRPSGSYGHVGKARVPWLPQWKRPL